MGNKGEAGGEINPHKDYYYYPDSMSESFDEKKIELKSLKKENEEAYKEMVAALSKIKDKMVRSAALDYLHNSNVIDFKGWATCNKTPKEALLFAFSWTYTKEGHIVWKSIFYNLSDDGTSTVKAVPLIDKINEVIKKHFNPQYIEYDERRILWATEDTPPGKIWECKLWLKKKPKKRK